MDTQLPDTVRGGMARKPEYVRDCQLQISVQSESDNLYTSIWAMQCLVLQLYHSYKRGGRGNQLLVPIQVTTSAPNSLGFPVQGNNDREHAGTGPLGQLPFLTRTALSPDITL